MRQSTPHPIQGIRKIIRCFLYEYDSMRLVAPSFDPQYSAWLQERSRNLGAYNQLAGLLGPTVALCALLCVLRIAFFRYVMPCMQRDISDRHVATARSLSSVTAPPAPATGKHPARGRESTKREAEAEVEAEAEIVAVDFTLRLGEGLWTLAGASVLLLWSWWCVTTRNGGCPTLPSLDTFRCLADWPLIPIPGLVRGYYCCEAAWYLHLLTKQPLRVGLQDPGLMVAHHIASLVLIVLSYCFSLHRPGVLLLALLNASTPWLHLSKIARVTGCRQIAVPAFAAFTAIFFISRVVLFPLVFLPLGLRQPLHHIPRVLELFPLTYMLFNGLLGLLVVMQWVWFDAVLRVLRQAVSGNEAKLEAEARRWEQQRSSLTKHTSAAGSAVTAGYVVTPDDVDATDREMHLMQLQHRVGGSDDMMVKEDSTGVGIGLEHARETYEVLTSADVNVDVGSEPLVPQAPPCSVSLTGNPTCYWCCEFGPDAQSEDLLQGPLTPDRGLGA
ncbi:hypothetical protein VaNZ11_000475 [Volvox africanus]|uniref:TLC domain-containing protein n=1 Tax=Volvox africanus TaxID=51714 RepID=A0ABQ5RMB1_9CHLO|nr:hypothetical protein VaNZ11_000475 [Volvox africanus]